jgi:16S rRNA (guanine527-N7)-methyltransferase
VLVGEDLLEEPTTVVRIVVNKPQKIAKRQPGALGVQG